MEQSFSNRLLIKLQEWIPARSIGRLIYWLTRIEAGWFKNTFTRVFCWLYSVDTDEAEYPVPQGYKNFNAFFTRRLKAGAREVDTAADSFVCPADGTLAQLGHADGTTLLQAKGVSFELADLLGDSHYASELSGSAFATIYLAPYNYHRLHMPIAGELIASRFIPGLLYSVNARTTAAVPGLYALNERHVCHFRTDHGPLALVLVGAMNVASISTAWGGEIFPPADGKALAEEHSGIQLDRGEYMGHFNMGSTIVAVGPNATLRWLESMQTGATMRMGQRMGTLH